MPDNFSICKSGDIWIVWDVQNGEPIRVGDAPTFGLALDLACDYYNSIERGNPDGWRTTETSNV